MSLSEYNLSVVYKHFPDCPYLAFIELTWEQKIAMHFDHYISVISSLSQTSRHYLLS